jgi:multisubunit Na+/H+ antiporter MnhE subunit
MWTDRRFLKVQYFPSQFFIICILKKNFKVPKKIIINAKSVKVVWVAVPTSLQS